MLLARTFRRTPSDAKNSDLKGAQMTMTRDLLDPLQRSRVSKSAGDWSLGLVPAA